MKGKLLLPIYGNTNTEFYTANFTRYQGKTSILRGVQIARGYTRVVVGDRGPYIEFLLDNLIPRSIYLPPTTRWRLSNPQVFYEEWRSKDDNDVFVYHQTKEVAYADYKVGLWYISPHLLTTDEYQELIIA